MKRAQIAVGVAAAVVLSTAAVPTAMGETGKEVRADGLTTTVTLITGDRVTVTAGLVNTEPGQGREKVRFHSYTDVDGNLHVVPSDAQPQLASGVLDQRLFDVSLLAKSGYDDRSRDTIPLIVQSGMGTASAGLASIGAHTAKAKKNGEFWTGVRAAGTTKVWLDGKVTASLDRSAKQIGAPAAWEQGLKGGGITVAVLDTGIDTTHPDLAGSVVEEKNFTDAPTTDDMFGHGTHVAATITGSGKYQGIAPDATLVNGKVLDDGGGGYESGIIAGMEWAAAKAKVVNMSLGARAWSAGDDPMSLALNRISAQTGALFVVSAGNSGSKPSTPAAADAALTVGAVDRDDTLASFSSRGPRYLDNAIKPDITAPGVGIVAAKAKNGFIGTPVGEGHVALSGTSMSSPHVAGAAAILAAQHPAWTGQDIKAALMNTAKPNPALSVYEQGAGRVDVAKAVSAQVTANVGSLSLGKATWPHTDDEPIIRKITYRNSGTTPVTLDLGVDEQKPVGPGLFSVTPAKLTVPAGGTAEATLTADTRVDVPDAMYSAVVRSSDGGRIPLNVEKEIELHDVKLTFRSADGNPTSYYDYLLTGRDKQVQFRWGDAGGYDPSGTVTRRLPRGEYVLFAYTYQPGEPDSVVFEPRFAVTGPTEFVLEGAKGTRPDIAIDRPEATDATTETGIVAKTAWGQVRHSFQGQGGWQALVQPSRTSAPDFEWYAQSVKARPDGNGAFFGSPYLYHVRISEQGKVPDTVRRRVSDAELARVDSVTHARVPGTIGRRDFAVSGPLPLRIEEFYTPDVPWAGILDEQAGLPTWPLYGQQQQQARTFKLGKKVTEHWNNAVFGPSFPTRTRPYGNGFREGGDMVLFVPMFSQNADSTSSGSLDGQEGRSVLSRNGEVLFDQAWTGTTEVFDLPAEKGDFRFQVTGTRNNSHTSKVEADWRFTSERTTEMKAVPLLTVRITPPVDEFNRGMAGQSLTIPVTVQRNGTAGDVTDVKTPEIQVSYDEGTTWQAVKVLKVGGKWMMTVKHPKDAKNVAFKAKTSDANGSVDLTIMRAYDLRK